MKLMKVLLMSSFIANSGSAELSLELTRKLSSKGPAELEITQESLFESANIVSSESTNKVEAKKSAIQVE